MTKAEAQARGAASPPDPEGDLLVISRVLAGDRQAFGELVRRHERRAYRVALAITGKPEDAEEAVQETFISALQHLGEFRQESRFTTWLTRIAVNEALQSRRRQKQVVSLDQPAESGDEQMLPRLLEDWHDDPEKLYARQEIREMVEHAIRSLPAIYREAFVLRDVEGLTTEEAAEALGQTVPAMKTRLLRARLMMREALAGRLARPPSLSSRLARAGKMIQGRVRLSFGAILAAAQGEIIMLDCKEVIAELSDYVDDEIARDLKRAVERHLAGCHRCSLIFDTTRRTLKMVTDVAPFEIPLEVSARLYERLHKLLV